jgi:hypothetical protein
MKKITSLFISLLLTTNLLAGSESRLAETKRDHAVDGYISFGPDNDHYGSIPTKISTMGFGIEYTKPINKRFSLSFGINKFNGKDSESAAGINYSADINFKSFSIVSNYHPFENNFRLNFGLYKNLNEIKLQAANATKIGGHVIPAGESASTNASITFGKLSPYIGIGYGIKPFRDDNVSLDFNLGLIKSSAYVDLTATGGGVTAADIAKEKEEVQLLLNDLKAYPVISIGLGFSF